MCICNNYKYVYPDGRVEKGPVHVTLCSASRHGRPCDNTVTYSHPSQHVAYPPMSSSAPAASPYLSAHFPPTPTYTPRSSTPNYRSGDESDRSGHRSGSSSRDRTRRSGPAVYINGQRVTEPSPRAHHVPPSPGTPSRSYANPFTTPPSPSSPYIVDASPHRANLSSPSPSSPSSRHAAVFSDRPRVEIDIIDVRRHHHKHSRHSSSSSHSHSHDESDSSHRRHRKQREAEKEQRRQAQHSSDKADRIARANAEIANRPTVPTTPRRSETSPHSRDTDADLVDAVRRMRMDEDEAQMQRLRERQGPHRRATFGSSSRRSKVVFDNGFYRWD